MAFKNYYQLVVKGRGSSFQVVEPDGRVVKQFTDQTAAEKWAEANAKSVTYETKNRGVGKLDRIKNTHFQNGIRKATEEIQNRLLYLKQG
jgi:hypothetical protein